MELWKERAADSRREEKAGSAMGQDSEGVDFGWLVCVVVVPYVLGPGK